MSAGSRSVKLGDICANITDGKHGDCQSEVGSGFYFLSCKDVAGGQLNYQEAREITESDFITTHQRTRLEPWDVLITNSGTIGRMAIAPDNELTRRTTFQKSVAILKPLTSLIEPRYLFYRLTFDLPRLIEFAGGTAQKNLLLRDLRAFVVEIPPLAIQGRIAAILSAYDDLIENNNRRIKLLEEMAQRIYREWFVDFRYPGHERVPLVDSESGRIPEGWRVGAFTDLADILSGGTPRTSVPEYWDGEIPFFTPRDVPGTLMVTNTEKHITKAGLERCNSPLYPPGTVFITARGTVGKVVMAGLPMAMNQSCYAIQGHKDVRQEFVLFALSNQVEYLKTNTGGATFDTIIVDTFRRMRSTIPPLELIHGFAQLVSSMIQRIECLQFENSNLRTTSALLLPRLISGDIDVTNLDIATPEAAA